MNSVDFSLNHFQDHISEIQIYMPLCLSMCEYALIFMFHFLKKTDWDMNNRIDVSITTDPLTASCKVASFLLLM